MPLIAIWNKYFKMRLVLKRAKSVYINKPR